MKAEEIELIDELRRGDTQQICEQIPAPTPERPTIHYMALPEDHSDGRISQEWNVYRREVGRLLAEGNEGRWLLIKDEEIVGIWDREEGANQVRMQRFMMQDVLIQQILTREPVLRGPTCFRLCRS